MTDEEKEEAKWMLAQQHKYESAADGATKEYNEIERVFGTQLLFASATILTLIATLVASNLDGFRASPIWLKIATISGATCMILAIAAGIVQYFISLRYLAKWQDANQDIVEQLSNSSLSTPVQLTIAITNRFKGLKIRSNTGILVAQALLIFIGILCISAGIFSIAF